MKVYLNGKLVEKEKAQVSVFDHGLLYGDGVFEGIRSYDRLVFKFKEHLDRLYRSAEAIELKIPMTKDEISKAVIVAKKIDEVTTEFNKKTRIKGRIKKGQKMLLDAFGGGLTWGAIVIEW